MEIWNDIVAKLKQVGVDTSETKSNEKTGEKKKETLFDGQLPDADDYSVLSSVESSAPATVGSYENAASLSAAKATSSNMTTSSDGRLLRNGIPFTGLYDNKRYVAGQLFTGIHNGVEYENGVVKGSSDPSDPGKVPTAQKGTKEYTAQLLNLNLDNYDVAETDGQGRVTKLKIKDSDGQVLAGGEDYVITYDDTNNTVTIKTTAHGIPTPGALYGIEKTFDANGKLIREFYPENASLGPQASSTLIIYNNDGSKVETEIFNDASVNDGVKTVITTYKTDGKTVDSVKKYDADGKEIKDTDNPGNEPKLGEFAYVGKMLGVELDESKFKVTLDNTGKVKKIESKRPGGDSYLVAYGNDGEIKITEYKKDIADAVKIQSTFDKDGNLTKTLLYGGLNGDSVETLYAKDGKVTQKTVIYAEPKDNVAKVVTTYDAQGVETVKKYDKDGNEIKISAGEVGTKEYIAKLLAQVPGLENFNLDACTIETDNTGKVVAFDKDKIGAYRGTITYDGDKVIIDAKAHNSESSGLCVNTVFPKEQFVFENGQLIQTTKDALIMKTVTDFKDGVKTQTTVTYKNPRDGVKKVVTTYKADGVTVDSVKKFDADGKEINDYEVVPGQGQKPYENVISPDGTVYHVKNFHNLSDAMKAKVIKILETKNNGVMAQGDVFYASITENADGSITVKNGVWGNVMWANDAWIPDESTFKFDNNGNITGFTVKEHQNTTEQATRVKEFDAQGNEINLPAAKKGSVEYVTQLLGENDWLTKNISIYEPKFDEQGRVISLTFNPPASSSGVRPERPNVLKYDIEYASDGTMTITAMGRSEEFDSVRKFDADGREIKNTPQIPAGEKGSKEYFAELLGVNFDSYSLDTLKYDSQGRITEFRQSYNIPTVMANNLHSGDKFSIKYNDDGTFSVTKEAEYRHDAIRQGDTAALSKIIDSNVTVTNYDANGNKVDSTQTVIMADGIKTVKKYDAQGNVTSVKKYDADGKEITTLTGEVGSEEYLNALFFQNNLKFTNMDDYDVEFDDQGRICKLVNRNTSSRSYEGDFSITYSDDGKITIENTDGRIGREKVLYDRKKWTFEDGKMTQSEIIYGNPRDGVARVVTAYDAEGSVISVKKFDADGHEIVQGPSGEKGSLEYAGSLLGKEFDEDNWTITKDSSNGNVIKIEPKETTTAGNRYSYEITYKDNGETEIKEIPNEDLKGAVEHTKTFNAEGRLIKETHPANASLGPEGWSGERIYNEDGTSVYTKTFVDPSKNGGAVKEVVKYDTEGKMVSSKTYDADGHVLSFKKFDAEGHALSEIPEGEQGSFTYIAKMVSDMYKGMVINDEFEAATYDDQGRITKLVCSRIVNTIVPWFEIAYNSDGSMNVKVENSTSSVYPNGEYKFDADGKIIERPVTSEVGSKEYLAGLLNVDLSKMDEVETKDGKVTYFVDKSTYSSGLVEYEIKYNNGDWTVTVTKDGKFQEKKTLTVSGEEIAYERLSTKGIEKYEKSGEGTGTYIGYTDNANKTVNYTVIDNYSGSGYPRITDKNGEYVRISFADKVGYSVGYGQTATINKDGTVVVKDKNGKEIYKFDKDGFQIVENKKTRASEVGSAAYIQRLLKQDFDMESATANVRYDSEGRITSFINRGVDGSDYVTFSIKYKDGKVDSITATAKDGTVTKYDGTGKIVSTTNPESRITDNNGADYPNGSGNTINFTADKSLTLADGEKALINEVGKVHIISPDGKIKVYTAIGEFCGTVVDNNKAEYPKLGGSVIYFSAKEDDYVRLVNGVEAVINADGTVSVKSSSNIASSNGLKKVVDNIYAKNGSKTNEVTRIMDANGAEKCRINDKTIGAEPEVSNVTAEGITIKFKGGKTLLLPIGSRATIEPDGKVYTYPNLTNDNSARTIYDSEGKVIENTVLVKPNEEEPVIGKYDSGKIKYKETTVTNADGTSKKIIEYFNDDANNTFRARDVIGYDKSGKQQYKITNYQDNNNSYPRVSPTAIPASGTGIIELNNQGKELVIKTGETAVIKDGTVTVYSNNDKNIVRYDKDGKEIFIRTANDNGSYFDSATSTNTANHKAYAGYAKDGDPRYYYVADYYNASGMNLADSNKYPRVENQTATTAELCLTATRRHVMKDGQTAVISASGIVSIKNKDGSLYNVFDKEGNALGTKEYMLNVVSDPDMKADTSKLKNIKTENGKITSFTYNGKNFKVSYTSAGSIVLKKLDSNNKVVQELKYTAYGIKYENIRKSATTKAEWGYTRSNSNPGTLDSNIKYYSKDDNGKNIYTVNDNFQGGSSLPKVTQSDKSSATITLANNQKVVVKDGQTATINPDKTVEIKDKNGKVIKKFDANGKKVTVITYV